MYYDCAALKFLQFKIHVVLANKKIIVKRIAKLKG